MGISKEQINASFDRLVKRANQFLEHLGLKHSIRQDNSSYTDPCIEFDGTGIGVSIFVVSKKTILGEVEIHFGAYGTTYDPGCRYHSDGSGTPPSEDLYDIGESSVNLDAVLIEAIKALVEQDINVLLDIESDNAEAEFYLENERLSMAK